MDTVISILSLALPLILAFTLRSRIVAIFVGTVSFWLLMITACEYNLARPDYDSFAPAITLIAGWLPGLVYSSLCVLAVMLATAIRNWIAVRWQRDSMRNKAKLSENG